MKMSSNSIVTIIFSVICFFFQQQAYAATLTVTSTADSGVGTLRQTILDAAIDDTITFDATAFPPATPTTITLVSQLTITRNLTINGNGGVILDANQTGRVMLIDDGTAAIMSVTLSGLSFKNGLVTGQGGGIYTKEHLTLADSIVTNNTATNSIGGGIHNETGATLTITNSSFTANIANDGGAIYNIGPLSVSGSTFNANHADNSGGAIGSQSATTTLTNSTVSGNSAVQGGGLIGYSSTVTINNATFAYNSASGSGGGLHLNHATLNLNSSIVSYNYNAANSAPDIYNYYSTINADHSLVATAAGHAVTDGGTNIVGQEALLFPLGHYGGPTQTHALQATSPCISTGSNALVLTLDQRGSDFPREVDSVDMGAVEYMANTLLSVSKEGNGSGSITSSPTGIDCGSECSASFDPNISVTLTATPGLETVFSGWSGACSGSGDCMVSMDQARSVTATFILNQYTITANAAGNGGGTVVSDAGGISYTYPAKSSDVSSLLDHGSAITLTATADTGSTVAWSGCTTTGGTTIAATCSFANLDSAKAATATFTLNQYTVTADAAGNGSGTVVSDAGGISYTYPAKSSDVSSLLDHGSAITLTATADTGSTVAWSGCTTTGGTTTAATCSFANLDSAKAATATFTLNQYTISANAVGNGNGTIVSDAGEISYTYPAESSDTSSLLDHGSAITLTATANTGSTVTWSSCAETGGTSSAATCSFASLDNSKLATATFNLDTYSLAILLEGNGTVTSSPEGIDCGLNCDATYAYNTEVTLTAIPAAKSVFKGWSGACSGTDNTCVVTVDQALSVGASFNGNFPWTMFLPAIINNAKK